MGPGSAMRQIISGLDPSIPGAKFRIDTVNKVADIVDAWWAEMSELQKLHDRELSGSLHNIACVTISKVMASALIGTIGYFNDEEAVANVASALAIVQADAEDYFNCEIEIPREMIEAARDISGFGHGSVH